jgi:murein DD-endopeptidase MepM/ murein hydrolase activator NlpD
MAHIHVKTKRFQLSITPVLTLSVLLYFCLLADVKAEMLTYTDEQGIVHFSNVPASFEYKIKIMHGPLSWPIGCIPNKTCVGDIGYPDIDGDGKAFNCGAPGYRGHSGTDIGISWEQMKSGMPVFAAADGQIMWIYDGKYDQCPNTSEPDCSPPNSKLYPGGSFGYTSCSPSGDLCDNDMCCCFWCLEGGNVIVIRHARTPGIFATVYLHLKKNSISVMPGAYVKKGQHIANAGSSGHSTGPHLHFEVWGSGNLKSADPWAGPCGPNVDAALWESDPPWSKIVGEEK